MLADFEQRTLDLANRLHDMTFAEWNRVRDLIDRKFKKQKKDLEREIKLSPANEDDLYLP